MYRTTEPTTVPSAGPITQPTTDLLATPWGSRRLPLPWSEPVRFEALAAPCRPELPSQRSASADLPAQRPLLGS